MSEKELLDVIGTMLNDMRTDMGSLLQAQQISNFIALSNNPQVPEDVRNQCLMRAMNLMGLEQKREDGLENAFHV